MTAYLNLRNTFTFWLSFHHW